MRRVTARRAQRLVSVELDIENPVIDLEKSDLPRMHERFWRKEQARSDSNHSGLGLSLVTALAGILRINVHLNLDEDGVFRVSLSGLQACE